MQTRILSLYCILLKLVGLLCTIIYLHNVIINSKSNTKTRDSSQLQKNAGKCSWRLFEEEMKAEVEAWKVQQDEEEKAEKVRNGEQ